ncbi:hypothetical protein Tco_0880025 [Tanacetum coccineum]
MVCLHLKLPEPGQAKRDGIFISQDKYVAEIMKKFDFMSVKTASTPIETQKPLTKDEEAADVDVHLYRSMIGSLMYLTASRLDIMFAVCACSRFQVSPKTSHLNAVKRIFRYLKGKPKLGLWYPKVSSFDLEAYLHSDYAGENLDKNSIIGGCQFLSRRLISWQCKKQTIVATSTTEAEYVATANYCGQVLWIQNQMLGLGFQFYEHKDLLGMRAQYCIVLKIHTDDNVADLLTKDFDVSSSIYYALTVSPKVSTSLIEQFWNSVVSKIVNNVSQIKATVSGKTVSISEASIRRDLLFNDEDGIRCLTNSEIYENLQLMGGGKRPNLGPILDDNAKLDVELDAGMEYIDTEEAMDEGRQSNLDAEDKGSGKKRGNIEELVSTVVPETVSTTRPTIDTVRQKDSTTEPITTSIFNDDEITMA